MEWDTNLTGAVFSIDNVELLGAGEGYGVWIDTFGLTISNRFAGVDADGDGLVNGDEFNIDALPNISSGPFTIAITNSIMTWNASSNCQYAVYRSTNLLSDAFWFLDAVDGAFGVMEYEDAENLPIAFYQVESRRKQ